RVLGMRDQAGLLATEIDAGGRAEAEGLRPLGDRRRPDLETGRVEVDVARVADPLDEIDAAVPLLLPVAECPRAEVELAVALHPIAGRERPLLETGCRH